MKKFILIIPIIMIFGISIKSLAFDPVEARKKWQERYNFNQDYTMDIYNDKNCYSEYKPPKQVIKEKKEKENDQKKDASVNKGYVYGVDELHVIGTPTDERGYTKAGDYGKIEGNNGKTKTSNRN